MCRVIDQLKLNNKVVLALDKPPSNYNYRKVWVDNVEYTPLPISHNIDGLMVAFVAEGNFIGKEVEFI